MQKSVVFILELLLSISIIITSCIGLVENDFYKLETINWQAQATGQDLVNVLIIVPCLLATSWFSFHGNNWAIMIKSGILLYLTYSFTIYCFDIHFNKLFLLYCFILGLSFYLFGYFIVSNLQRVNQLKEKDTATKTSAVYFLIISTLFYILWLSEIIPASLRGIMPQSLIKKGLFTNGVQVIDLALFLPGVFIIGLLLLKRSQLGFILTPAVLTFFILMDITIATLVAIMYLKKMDTNLSIMALMGLLDVFSLALLIWFLRKNVPMKGHSLQ